MKLVLDRSVNQGLNVLQLICFGVFSNSRLYFLGVEASKVFMTERKLTVWLQNTMT